MATTHTLNLVRGSTTIQLAQNAVNTNYLMKYVPKRPQPTSVRQDYTLQSGGELRKTTYRNVTETAEVLITASSRANWLAALDAIEQMLTFADDRQSRLSGDKTYLVYQPGGYASAYRSEILFGRCEYDTEALDFEQWGNIKIRVVLNFERRFYWEANSETELSLSNSSGTGTGGIRVGNRVDGVDQNYVDIAAASITGSIPAPFRLQMHNDYAPNYTKFNLGISNAADVTLVTHFFEGESSLSIGSNTSSANYSGGAYRTATWATGVETDIYSWSLTSAMLNGYQNRYYRAIAAILTGSTTGVSLHLEVRDLDGNVLFRSEAVTSPDTTSAGAFVSLGNFRLPPGLQSSAILDPLALYITGNGDGTIKLDYLELLPCDSARIYTTRGTTTISTDREIWDDGMTGEIYVMTPSAFQMDNLTVDGPIPLLLPNVKNRLYFTFGVADIPLATNQLLVRVYFRERRLIV